MNVPTHLLILSTFDLIYDGMGRFVFVNKNLTYMAAWTRCHDKYKGKLANLDKWTYSSQGLQQFPCFEMGDFFWHGSLIKNVPWIEFEGCFSYVNYSTAIIMPYTSLAWCQNRCTNSGRSESYFGVQGSLCQCDVNIRLVSPVKSKQCNISCDGSAMCGGNGYISLYSRVPQSTFDLSEFESPENIDYQCLVYMCASSTSVTVEAAKCTDLLPFVCENVTGLFHSTRREQWLTSNILCTKMLTSPMCRNVTLFSDLKAWTSIFRVQEQFKDEVSMTMVEIERFLSSSFHTTDREGRRIQFSDGLKQYPSLCETDISVEELINDDRVCYFTNETDVSTTQTKYAHLGFEYLVIIGPSIGVLLTEVGFVVVYCIFKRKRQQRDMNYIEMQIRAPRAHGIISGPTLADISSAFSNVNASDLESPSSKNNPPVFSITNRDRMNISEADNPVSNNKSINDDLNGVSSGNVETVYNEVEDDWI